MKKVFFSAAMSLLLLAGFSSCKNDDPEPPKPPVVEDVLGSYSAENLALTVTGGTPGANPEVVLLQSDGKTKVRLTNVVPNNEDFTINDVTYSAVETKAYVSQISGTETSDLAGYTVEFAGTVDAEGKLTATVKLTEIPAAPIEDVASLQSTYKGQLVVNVNGNAFPGMEQRVYLDKGSKYTSNKSLAKLTIKNLSILDMEISQIQLNNLVVSQRGSVALIDSVGYAYNLPAPLSMKALIDVTGTIVDKTITLSLKIALVDDASMQIGVGFSGTAVTENTTAKLESLSVESPAIVKNFDPAKPSSTNTFTVLSNAKAEDLQIAPKATLGEGCTFASIETNIGGQTAEIKEGDKIDFSKFGKNDYVAYNVVAQDPNYTKRYILKIAVLPVAQDEYLFNTWVDGESQNLDGTPVKEPKGWATSNGAASLIHIFDEADIPLYPKNPDGSFKPLPVTQSGTDAARVGTLMTKGGNAFITFIPAVTAGTLFIGSFQVDPINTLRSTRFGLPFVKTAFPKSFDVTWKYQAGTDYYITQGTKNADGSFTPEYKEDGTLYVLKPGETDKGSVAVVIYEVSDYVADYLDGTNLQTDARIAARAVLEKSTSSSFATESQAFEVKKAFDPSKKYKIAIVFSSSAKGDSFEGGEDSELFVKSIKLNY